MYGCTHTHTHTHKALTPKPESLLPYSPIESRVGEDKTNAGFTMNYHPCSHKAVPIATAIPS